MKRPALAVLAFAVLGALLLSACGESSSNLGSTAIQESPAEAIESQNPESSEAMGEESTGEGAEAGAGEGAGTAEEEPEPGSKADIVPNEGELEEPAAGQKPGGNESEEVEEGGAAALAAGQSIFETNCATCHTLAEAGATGEVGPNLDELKPGNALVEKQVTMGGGGMPAFEGVLDEEEISAVAAYVSTVAGTEG
jgi:mono/diheme cytochrome c family protein